MELISTVLILLHARLIFSQESIALSLGGDPQFLQQKQCVKGCINDSSPKGLIGGIGCSFPYNNDCMCRADQASPASLVLTSCVSSQCGASATIDISRAVSVYDAYCSGAGYTDGHAVQPTPTDSAPETSAAIPGTPTKTETTFVTETASSSGGGNHSVTPSGEFWILGLALAVYCSL